MNIMTHGHFVDDDFCGEQNHVLKIKREHTRVAEAILKMRCSLLFVQPGKMASNALDSSISRFRNNLS